MAKKKDDKRSGSKSEIPGECNLDGDYISPIKTARDYLSFANIKSLVLGSRYVQVLILFVVAGSFLRFFDLGFNSIWLDEATTYYQSLLSPLQIWQSMNLTEFNPPLFYWMEHFMLMLGKSEIILRFIPAVVGILTIPLLYVIGKEFFDKNVGIIAAAAWAVSPFMIYYSQEARAYAVMLFFISLAIIFYLRAFKNSTLTNWTLFGLFSAVAFWAHFYVFILIVALFIFPLFLWAPNIKNELNNLKMLIIAGVVFLAITFPLIIVAVRLFGEEVTSANVFGMQGLMLVVETFNQISGFSYLLAVLFVCLFIVGVIQAFLIDKTKGLFLTWTVLFTLCASYILSSKMSLFPRHQMFIAIMFFTGVAISYKVFYSLWHHKAVVYLFVTVLVLVSVPVLATYYSEYSKDDWRGFAGYLEGKAHPGDEIVTVPGYMSQPLNFYYSNATAGTTESGANSGRDLANLYAARDNSTIYFVVTQDIYAEDPAGDAVEWLNNNTKTIGHDGGIFLFSTR